MSDHGLLLEPLRDGNIVRATCQCNFTGWWRVARESAEQDFRAHMDGVTLKALGDL